MFDSALTILLAILLILFAFFSTGVRGAFSKGPWLPLTKTGRVILFVGGLLMLVMGIREFMK